MSYEQPRGRLARLFEAADRRHVPLRTILITVAAVVATHLASQDAFRTGGYIVSACGDGDARLWLLAEAADDTGDRCHGVPAAG